jgi:transcriptional regulator with XRE-family HTH domain
MQLGNNIQTLRKKKGLSQEKLAEKIHIRRPYIKTCVSHAPGVRRFCQYSLTLNFAIFTIKAADMSMVYKYYEKS